MTNDNFPRDWINERCGPQGDVEVSEGKEITGADFFFKSHFYSTSTSG